MWGFLALMDNGMCACLHPAPEGDPRDPETWEKPALQTWGSQRAFWTPGWSRSRELGTDAAGQASDTPAPAPPSWPLLFPGPCLELQAARRVTLCHPHPSFSVLSPTLSPDQAHLERAQGLRT